MHRGTSGCPVVSRTDSAGVETVPRPRHGDRKCAVGRGCGGHVTRQVHVGANKKRIAAMS